MEARLRLSPRFGGSKQALGYVLIAQHFGYVMRRSDATRVIDGWSLTSISMGEGTIPILRHQWRVIFVREDC